MASTKTVRYVGPHDRIHVPSVGKFDKGDDIEVDNDHAEGLIASGVFEAASKSTKTAASKKAADTQESDD